MEALALMKAHTIWLILMTFAMTSESSEQVTKLKYVGNVHQDSRGMLVAFPDICKTPSLAAPVSVPYPNVGKSRSDFGKGTKKIKGGGKFQVTEVKVRTNIGNQAAFKVRLVNKSGQEVKFSKSQLIEFDDGSFCAVCVNKNGAVTALLRLAPARAR